MEIYISMLIIYWQLNQMHMEIQLLQISLAKKIYDQDRLNDLESILQKLQKITIFRIIEHKVYYLMTLRMLKKYNLIATNTLFKSTCHNQDFSIIWLTQHESFTFSFFTFRDLSISIVVLLFQNTFYTVLQCFLLFIHFMQYKVIWRKYTTWSKIG